MQERYFPLVMLIYNGKFEQTAPFGLGHATPEDAHLEGQSIDSTPIQTPFVKDRLCSKIYQNRVQALWVPIQ